MTPSPGKPDRGKPGRKKVPSGKQPMPGSASGGTPGTTPGPPTKPNKPKRGRPKVILTSRKMEHGYRSGYNEEDMLKAINMVIEQGFSIRQAAEECNVPKSTLSDSVSRRHDRILGRPKALSDAEEKIIKERLLLLGTWGYPVTKEELRRLVKDYLDRVGKNIEVFTDNMPGRNWLNAYLKRHSKDLTI